MNNEEIRIAIAESLGFKRNEKLDLWRKGNKDYFNCGSRCYAQLPNYPEDLNACAEFERSLGVDEKTEYCVQLRKVIDCLPGAIFAFVTASALQRCEAFLRTKNLWK